MYGKLFSRNVRHSRLLGSWLLSWTLQVKFSPHVVKLDDGSSVPSTMTPGLIPVLIVYAVAEAVEAKGPAVQSSATDLNSSLLQGSGTGQERRVLEDMIPSSGTVASPSMFTGPVASPPRQSFEVKEAKSSPKAPSPGTGEIPSPSFPARGPCTSHYSFGPLSFQREEEVPALGSPPQPPQARTSWSCGSLEARSRSLPTVMVRCRQRLCKPSPQNLQLSAGVSKFYLHNVGGSDALPAIQLHAAGCTG